MSDGTLKNGAPVKDINALGKQKIISMDFDEEKAREGRQGNHKICELITFK